MSREGREDVQWRLMAQTTAETVVLIVCHQE